ncbi:MAG: murein DD-endopeptidase MepM/ murein hydrolase activator NlpD [Limisphaerales bacterium]|jgi:murein DD-endopeptidase MepM/ murein hydrolase activator NlpD
MNSIVSIKSLPTNLFLTMVVYIISVSLLASCGNTEDSAQAQINQEEIISESEYLYGICIDSMEVIEGEVERNQFLADILLPYQVKYQLIDKIGRDHTVFDVRRIRAGNPYRIIAEPQYFAHDPQDSLLHQGDTLLKAKYFVYEIDKVNYVVYDLGCDSLSVYKAQKPIRIVEKQVAGVIESSLYQSLVNSGASPVLANELGDIYAWSVDFYRINPGDRYKAIYSEKWVEDQRIGIDSIFAACFNYRDVDFFAFNYSQDSLGSYYDEEGNSLQKAFLQAPLKYSRISSRFSKKRLHPVLKRYKSHLGTDYAAPTGTAIRSTGDGVVVAASYTKGNGNYVKVKHNSTYTTQYLHMSKFGKGIHSGKAVKQGQVIGYVGSTGLATGPHLCYRFWKNGVQVDPFNEKLPPAFPVKEDHKPVYNVLVNKWTTALDGISYPELGVSDQGAIDPKTDGPAVQEASPLPSIVSK